MHRHHIPNSHNNMPDSDPEPTSSATSTSTSSAQPTQPQQQTLQFFTLPPELRHRIYSDLLPNAHLFIPQIDSPIVKRGLWTLSYLLVSKQFSAEVLPVLQSRLFMHVGAFRRDTSVADTVPQPWCDAITTLSLRVRSQPPMRLRGRLSRLRVVVLGVEMLYPDLKGGEGDGDGLRAALRTFKNRCLYTYTFSGTWDDRRGWDLFFKAEPEVKAVVVGWILDPDCVVGCFGWVLEFNVKTRLVTKVVRARFTRVTYQDRVTSWGEHGTMEVQEVEQVEIT